MNMNVVGPVCDLSEGCRRITGNSSQRARTLARLSAKGNCKARARHITFAGSGSQKQDQHKQQAPTKQSPSAKPLRIKSVKSVRGKQGQQSPISELPDALYGDEAHAKGLMTLVSDARRARFAERLQDAQRVEDLFELIRDAESLAASEVAQLPVALMKLYQNRPAREQQALGSQPFFEALIKPWALEPDKLSVQEQITTLACLVEIDDWSGGVNQALAKAIFMVAHAVRSSLQAASNQFTAAELLQLMRSCNSKPVLRKACPQLPLACLTACSQQLDSLTPDQLAQIAFLSVQTKLRLNESGSDHLRLLVSYAIAQAAAMKPLHVTQLLYAAVSLGGIPSAKMQSLIEAVQAVLPKCDAAGLKNLSWALGHARIGGDKLLTSLEQQLWSQKSYLGASHVAMAVWAFGRLEHFPELSLMQELSNQAMLNSSKLSVMHSQMLMWGFNTLGFYPPEALLEAIAKRLTPAIKRMDVYSLSQFIWAFGGLDYEPSNMQLLLQAVQERTWEMNAIDISQILRGLANLRINSRVLLHDLCSRATEIMDNFDSKALANMAWSIAHLEYRSHSFLDNIVSQLLIDPEDINQRDLGQLMSAFAMLNYQPIKPAMQSLMQHTIELLQDEDTTWLQEDLSIIVWSMAKLDVGNRKLLDLIYKRVVPEIPNLSAKDISFQLWAFVVLGYPLQTQVVKTYEDSLLRHVDDVDPVCLSYAMWAIARLDSSPAPGAIDSLLSAVGPQIQDAEPVAVTTIVHACGEMRHQPDDQVLEHVLGHARTHSSRYDCADWTALLQAFTRLQVPAKQLHRLIVQEMQTGNLDADSKLVGDCLMSVAVSEAWQEPVHRRMVARARTIMLEDYDPRSLRQLYHIDLLAQITGAGVSMALSDVSRIQTQRQWLSTRLQFNVTDLVSDICTTLQQLQIPFQLGIPASPALLTLDIALVDRKVAIEGLGPIKFLQNKPKITGATAFRLQLLAAVGWTVVPIKKTDWFQLERPEDKQQFLQELLAPL